MTQVEFSEFIKNFNIEDKQEEREDILVPDSLRELEPFIYFFSVKNIVDKHEYFVSCTNQYFIETLKTKIEERKNEILNWIESQPVNDSVVTTVHFIIDFIENYSEYYAKHNFLARLSRKYNS